MLNKSQLAILHIAAKELGLDEETYRDALQAHAGVRSAKELDYRGFQAIMGHFERAGFKRHQPANRPTGEPANPARRGMATAAQLRKIFVLWWSLGGSYYRVGSEWKALRGFLKKRFRVDHENFLSFEKAHQAIEAMKKIGDRVDRREAPRDGDRYGRV